MINAQADLIVSMYFVFSFEKNSSDYWQNIQHFLLLFVCQNESNDWC